MMNYEIDDLYSGATPHWLSRRSPAAWMGWVMALLLVLFFVGAGSGFFLLFKGCGNDGGQSARAYRATMHAAVEVPAP
jgi:hypothetical protein